MNRREFLKSAVAVSAAALLPTFSSAEQLLSQGICASADVDIAITSTRNGFVQNLCYDRCKSISLNYSQPVTRNIDGTYTAGYPAGILQLSSLQCRTSSLCEICTRYYKDRNAPTLRGISLYASYQLADGTTQTLRMDDIELVSVNKVVKYELTAEEYLFQPTFNCSRLTVL